MTSKTCLNFAIWSLALVVCAPASVVAQSTSAAEKSADPSVDSSSVDATVYPHTVQRDLDEHTYRVGPGDILRVTVWDEPQLETKAIVRPDGKISLPLVADVMVAGLTPVDAQHLITDQLSKYVKHPRVNVIVEEIQSRIVYITGEVQHPGAYPLLGMISVSQLIARAGGTTEFAHKKAVFVMRPETGQRLKVDYEKILSGKAVEQNIALIPGDTVVIP